MDIVKELAKRYICMFCEFVFALKIGVFMGSRVISGNFCGCCVDEIGICYPNGKPIIHFCENVVFVQILGQDSRKSALSGIGRGIVGGLVLGPVGLLGGVLSAKNVNTFMISVIFKDGKSCVISATPQVCNVLAKIKVELEAKNLQNIHPPINVTPVENHDTVSLENRKKWHPKPRRLLMNIEELPDIQKSSSVENVSTIYPVFTPPLEGKGLVLNCPSCEQEISVSPDFLDSIGLCPLCNFQIKLQLEENTKYVYTVCQCCGKRLDGIVEICDNKRIVCPYCLSNFIPIEKMPK